MERLPKKDLYTFFSGANPLAIDLLELMLEIDSDIRITAEKALAHPYLSQYADPTDEPISEPYDQTIEDMDLAVENWKGKFVTYFHGCLLKHFCCIPSQIYITIVILRIVTATPFFWLWQCLLIHSYILNA